MLDHANPYYDYDGKLRERDCPYYAFDTIERPAERNAA